MDARLAQELLTASRFLSSMPVEVFNFYISPLIEAHGWPFDSEGLPLNRAEALRWFQMFDHQSVQTISQLSWERTHFSFDFKLFHPTARNLMKALIEHHGGIAFYAALAHVADSRNKFFNARDYIARSGGMPVPVVLMFDPMGGLRILDGNHRLAAMASFNNAGSGIVDAWVGALITR